MNLLENYQGYTLLSVMSVSTIESSLKVGTMSLKTYSKQEVIHFDSDICDHIEVILTGQVIVERIDESGDLLTVGNFFPDDIIGGNLVFSKNPHYPMTVTAQTDTTLLKIHKDLLFQLCASNPLVLSSYLEYICDHATLLGDKIKHYVNRTIRESLMAYLKNEYMLQETCHICLNSSKKALADRIGVQRTSLSRELQKMKKDGLIDFDKTHITIKNLDAF